MKNNNTYIFALTLVATLGGLLFGYDTAVISGTVESLRKFFIEPQGFPLDQANALEGFVVSSALIGCILGASFAGWISQRYGRKPTLILGRYPFLAFRYRLGLAGAVYRHARKWRSYVYVCVRGLSYSGRYRCGAGLHGIADVYRRGGSGRSPGESGGMEPVCHYLWYAGGIFRELYDRPSRRCLLAEYDGWRWMFASEIIPAVLFLSFLMFVPETPRYLVMRGRTEKALGVLSHLMDRADAGRELEDIRNSFKEKAPSMKPYFRFMGTWLALFLAGYGLLSWAGNTNALEIALLASFCIALLFPIRSFGVLIILVGVLLSGFQQFVGINVVLYYAPEIFKTMGAATDAALLQQIVVGAVNLSFTVLAIFTVDKFGRRPLMIIGALVMAVSMLILGTTFYTRSVGMGSLVCMLVYTAGFAMSWGPVCWVLLAEIFPNSIRSTVMSIAVAAQWIANFLVHGHSQGWIRINT